MNEFWLCFVQLFVAVDALGVLPVFIGLTEGLNPRQVRSIILQSIFTAALVAILFLLLGKALLDMLGISPPDFMIAGGSLLFVISMGNLVSDDKSRRKSDPDSVGAVPIGVPLITGPAVLTTCLLLSNQFGTELTLFATVLNIVIAGIVFRFAGPLTRFLGHAGTKTLSKIAHLLLATIGVMMIRKGIFALLANPPR